MKGVSDIIAEILMLVITIGIVGTAYMYISGMMTSKTAFTISVIDYSCIGTGATRNINLVISNDGTTDILNGDVKIYVDNQDRTSDFGAYAGGVWAAGANCDIDSHTIKPILTNPTAAPAWLSAAPAGQHSVLVVTASNAQKVSVICP